MVYIFSVHTHAMKLNIFELQRLGKSGMKLIPVFFSEYKLGRDRCPGALQQYLTDIYTGHNGNV